MLLVNSSEMARIDRKTIEDIGIPGMVLMENAARGAAAFYQEEIPDLTKCRIAVIAGSGNNGGDGFVLARLFSEKGAKVRVICLRPPEKIHGDARANYEILLQLNIAITVWDEKEDFNSQFKLIRESDVIIDAILGTGLNSEVRGLFREVIEAVNQLDIPVLAVDIPSGVDAGTGRVLGVAIRAKATATFALPKIGQVLDPGEEYVGTLKVVDIGIPACVLRASDIRRFWLQEEHFRDWLKPREVDTHKGRAGHVAVLSGSVGKTGAATLVCEGAVQVGAGLVTLFIPASLNPVVEVKLTEPMTLPIPETMDQTPAMAALPKVLDFLTDKQAFAIGPGISLHAETQQLVRTLVNEAPCPMVLDADALTALVDHGTLLKSAKHPPVLTPHPGEMARLCHCSSREVLLRRLEIAAEFSEQFGVILVLKGHRTVIAAPDGRLAVNGSGNPAMASGGMGDALTGIIAGFIGQGLEPFKAACLGAFVHGAAADRRIARIASRGLPASQILAEIPHVIGRLEGY